MEDRNKFQQGNDENNRDEHQDQQKESRSGSAYYGYGSFTPNNYNHNESQPASYTTSRSESGKVDSVEIGVYQSQYSPVIYEDTQKWSASRNKKSSFRTAFISFLAGALVVSSLMFASDRMNLFTGDQALESGVNSTSTQGANPVQKASYNVERPDNIAAIFEQSSPAVVKIETYARASSRSSNNLFSDPFFRQFFGLEQDQGRSNDNSLRQSGMGSGFIFDKEGYILTNAHVVSNAAEIYVLVEGYEEPFKAELLGHDESLDLAALKITGNKDFATLPIGDSNTLSIGDWVVAIGNPYGFDHTVTVGVLSAIERPITVQDNGTTRQYKNLLQTDASINPGNSGGPLLNLNGEVIGINTAVSTEAQGIGFAIPTSTIMEVLDQLKNNEEIPKEAAPYLGIGLNDLDETAANELKLDNTNGALVTQVEVDSPAYRAGLRTFDVIVAINGDAIKISDVLVKKVQSLRPGDRVTLTLYRDGKKMDVAAIIGDRNAS